MELKVREFCITKGLNSGAPDESVPQWKFSWLFLVINFHRRLLGNFYHFWYLDLRLLDEEKLRETGEEPFHGTTYFWIRKITGTERKNKTFYFWSNLNLLIT